MTPPRRPGAGDNLQQIESELAALFRRARELLKITAAEVHPALNVAGYATLVRLVDDGPLRASTLADHFGTDKGSMSRHVAQLERLGLVRRTQDAADGRAQVVSATPLGARRAAAGRAASHRRLQQRIGGWDEAHVAAFAGLLRDFNAALADEQ